MVHTIKSKCVGCPVRRQCAAVGKHGQCFRSKEAKRKYEAFKHMHVC